MKSIFSQDFNTINGKELAYPFCIYKSWRDTKYSYPCISKFIGQA